MDSVGLTPVDPLVAVTSEDLDTPGHPSEQVIWVWPDDVEQRLATWAVQWSDVRDDRTGARFAS